MATTVSSVPGVATATLSVSDQATEIKFPSTATKITVLFTTNDGQIATSGTDGGAIGTSAPVSADQYFELRVRPPGKRAAKTPQVFVAATTVPTTVTIIAEED